MHSSYFGRFSALLIFVFSIFVPFAFAETVRSSDTQLFCPDSIYSHIPADSLCFAATAKCSGLRTDIRDFIESIGKGTIPSDLIGLALAITGFNSVIDLEKGLAIVVPSEAYGGMSVETLTSLDDQEWEPEKWPLAVIIGSQAERLFKKFSPTIENDLWVAFGSDGRKYYGLDIDGDYCIVSTNQQVARGLKVLKQSDSVAARFNTSRLEKLNGMSAFISISREACEVFCEKQPEPDEESGISAELDENGVNLSISGNTESFSRFKAAESLDIGLSIKPDGLIVDFFAVIREGTDFSQAMSSVNPSAEPLFGMLPDEKYVYALSFDVGDTCDADKAMTVIKSCFGSMVFPAVGTLGNNFAEEMFNRFKGSITGRLKGQIALQTDGDMPFNFYSIVKSVEYDKYFDALVLAKDFICEYETEDVVSPETTGITEKVEINIHKNNFRIDDVNVSTIEMKYPEMDDFLWSKMDFMDRFVAKLPDDTIAIATGKKQKLISLLGGYFSAKPFAANEHVIEALSRMPENPFVAIVSDAEQVVKSMINTAHQLKDHGNLVTRSVFMNKYYYSPTCPELLAGAISIDNNKIVGRCYVPSGILADFYQWFLKIKYASKSSKKNSDIKNGF